MDVIHTAVWVSDIDRTLEFYVDALGLERTNQFEGGDGAMNYYVGGNADAEIQFKHDPDGDAPDTDAGGLDHLALGVDDCDGEVERLLEETDTELVRGPLTSEGANARVAFVTDPDGYTVELVEHLD